VRTWETELHLSVILGSRSKLGQEMRSRLSTLMMEAVSRIVGADE
jgi:hypothetical protein